MSTVRVRIIAAPGDVCLVESGSFMETPQVVPCGEGDAGSLLGYASCGDAVDNDLDSLLDLQDPDCTGQVTYIIANRTATQSWVTFSRYVVSSACIYGVQFRAEVSGLDTNPRNNSATTSMNVLC